MKQEHVEISIGCRESPALAFWQWHPTQWNNMRSIFPPAGERMVFQKQQNNKITGNPKLNLHTDTHTHTHTQRRFKIN